VKDLIKEAQQRQEKEGGTDNIKDLPLRINFPALPVCGDIKTEIDKLLHFWVHTAYVGNRVLLTQSEIDRVHKDRKNKIVPPGFKIEMIFTNPTIEKGEIRNGITALCKPDQSAPPNSLDSDDSSPDSSFPKSCLLKPAQRSVFQHFPSLNNL